MKLLSFKKWHYLGIILFTINIGVLELAHAYPQFIGYGYQSCLTCHYNPFGNGPLTDYGRAVSATAISAKPLHNDSLSDETLGQRSGFLFSTPKNTWFRPNLDYRGLYLKRNFGEPKSESEIIHMDANATLALKFLEKDKLVFIYNFGYAPEPRGRRGFEDEPNYRSREHYIGYRFTPHFGIYAGLMDKVFGQRIPDHIAFSRSITGLAMNDQSHGLVLHFAGENWEWGINPFIGNLVQDAPLRQVGASSKFDYHIASSSRVGASVLSSKSDFLEYLNYALHGSFGAGKGSAVLLEIGESSKTTIKTGNEVRGRYALGQGYLNVARGSFVLLTTEYYRQNVERQSYVMRFGPGFQYFPMQRIELRFDAYNSRIFSDSLVTEDTWDITGQMHLWF